MEENEQERVIETQDSFAISGSVNPAGKFEVDAITAGEGNGWNFTEECLRESLALWDGVECFVDHGGGGWGGRSVRDLGGVFRNPRWSGETKGVRMELDTLGPSGALVAELGRQLLGGPQAAPAGPQAAPAGPQAAPAEGEERHSRPRVGFSADIVFRARQKQVEKILRVLSVDLVFNPARGGAFVRALNSVEKESSKLSKVGQSPIFAISCKSNIKDGGELMSEAIEAKAKEMGEEEGRVQLQAELEKAQEARREINGFLLEATLGASNLPAAMIASLRGQFGGQDFDPAQLHAAIDQARKLVSDLTGPAAVQGPGGRITSMFSTEDQLQAAVDDLLEAPRDPGKEGLKAHRLSGIRELYMLLTGDHDLHGGYYQERVSLASSVNFPGLVKNALNKIVANQWAELGGAGYDWWRKVATVEHFDTTHQITGILVGTVGDLPAVDEGGDYTALKIGDSPETADFIKYGGYVPMTLELIDRDDTRKLRVYPRELAKAGIRKVSRLVAEVFTSGSGAGPTLADTGALFNATAVTTKGGHANLGTAALAEASWEAAKQAMYKQPLLIANETNVYGTGPRMALKPRYCLVPVELELTAMKLLYGEWVNAANIHADNQQRQSFGDVVVVPEWTDANDWAAVADPRMASGIVVGERFGIMPEIFIAGDELSPAMFTNDEARIKVRHFIAVLVQDFRPLYKANVA